ncbi:hypothetical protein [Azospirillum sp. ST 5-10]|uniref:hypothetical protein n=1 Tax=unclassified Azospirillum TaxID=2630922 RepID=UPI003F49ED84
MGSVADKIARKVATQIRSNVIDPSAFRASRELAVEAGLDGGRFKDLVEQGYDPEPRRDSRRPIWLSYAAMATSSAWA